jgi:hypothetical protein
MQWEKIELNFSVTVLEQACTNGCEKSTKFLYTNIIVACQYCCRNVKQIWPLDFFSDSWKLYLFPFNPWLWTGCCASGFCTHKLSVSCYVSFIVNSVSSSMTRQLWAMIMEKSLDFIGEINLLACWALTKFHSEWIEEFICSIILLAAHHTLVDFQRDDFIMLFQNGHHIQNHVLISY